MRTDLDPRDGASDEEPKVRLKADGHAAMTDWENEPSVSALQADLLASKSSQSIVVNRINHWRDIIDASGSEAPKKYENRSSVQPKLARRQNEWRYSALSEPLLGSDKLFEAKPVTFEDVKASQQNELVLNHQFRTNIHRVDFIDKYVRAAVDEGTAILRVGWHRETRKVQKEVPVFALTAPKPEEIEYIQQAVEYRKEDPNGFATEASPALIETLNYFDETGELLIHTETGQMQMVTVEEVVANRPTVETVDPRNIYVDPTCEGDQSKIKFAIQLFETSRADLEASGVKYQNLDRVVWPSEEPNANADITSNGDRSFQFADKARKRAVAYEYWGFYDVHGDGQLTSIVATWIGNTLIRMEENPFPDKKIPYVFVNYMPVKRRLFGEADAEFLGDNQRIQGAITRGVIDLIGRSANGQQGFAKGMLDPVNKRRMESGQNYDFNPQIHPQNGFVEHKFPEIPQSALAFLQMINMDAESMTGIKAFTGGVSGDSYGQVAAGVRGALDAASKREMAILRRLAAGLVEVARRWAAMNGEFLEEEEVVRITNETFVKVRRDELSGKFDLVMDISTAEVDNAKSQDLGFLLQTLGPVGDLSMIKMILSEICRLKRMPELAKAIKDFTPEPDELEQMKKQLEIEELKAKIAKLQAEAAAEEAKAEEAVARTQALQLDYVEQSGGIRHERDMERIATQAEAQADAEVTKALVKPRKEGEAPGRIEEAINRNTLQKMRPMASTPTVDSLAERDALQAQDPRLSIGSGNFEPQMDPALNLNLNL